MIKASDLRDDCKDIKLLIGDQDLVVSRPVTLDEIGDGALAWIKSTAGDVEFAKLETGDFRAAVVCTAEAARRLSSQANLTLLVTENPRLTIARLVRKFFSEAANCPVGVHPSASVDPSASIDPSAAIAAFCSVGANCVIGAKCILHPHVVLYDNVRLGRSVIVHSGTTVGADGFGYVRNEVGELERFPHIGSVIIEDEVEIGSNSNVDRGALGATVVRRGTKIDNQVHVGHNSDVGEHVVITAQCLVGAHVRVLRGAYIAPTAIIMNQLTVGAGAMVGTGAIVSKDVPDGETVMGSPAVPQAEFRRTRAALRALSARSNET